MTARFALTRPVYLGDFLVIFAFKTRTRITLRNHLRDTLCLLIEMPSVANDDEGPVAA